MLDSGLYRLYKLHLVDAALHELKAHASALDAGQGEAAEFKKRLAESEPVRSLAKDLEREQRELNDKQRTLIDKRTNFQSKLYSGQVVNSREAANIEKEIEQIGEQLDNGDMRLFELMDLIPPAEAAAKKEEQELAKLQRAVQVKQKEAAVELEKLKVEYAEVAKKRAPAAAKVSKPLLDQYENLKGKIGVPAMSLITEKDTCGACGIHVPERTREYVRQDRVTTCEACKRILFAAVPGDE